jgi:aldehyde dehydrogenase (NAD+)
MAYLMASHGRNPSGRILPSSRVGRQVREQRVPRGVALLIVSYNTPLPNYAWKVFPALMAGNSVILKPSPATPASANIFVELLHRAGVPTEALQVLHGEGDVAQAVIKQGVELVSFTGSYEAGVKVAQSAYPSLAKTILELGGSNPFIVCSDADIESAVDALIDSAFSNSGQRCASGSRAIIEASIYESFRSILLDKCEAVTWGTDPDVNVSTLIDEKARERFESMLEAASQEFATVHRVGTRKGSMSSNPCLSQPAVLEGIPPESGLSTSEIFGPATRLCSFRDDVEAIQLANSSPYGLTAAIWTQDVSRAEKFVTQIEAGLININGPTHGAEVNMPFGGMKKSGNGTRDAGSDAFLQYSDSQVVTNFLST